MAMADGRFISLTGYSVQGLPRLSETPVYEGVSSSVGSMLRYSFFTRLFAVVLQK